MANPNAPRTELHTAIRSLKRYFIGAGIFSFFINLLYLVPSLYMLQVYDRVLASRSESTLWMLTIILAVLLIMMAAIEWVRSRLLVQAGLKLDADLKDRVFSATFRHGLRYSGANAGQTLTDVVTIRQFLTGNGLFAFFDAPWAPIFLIVLFILHPVLGLVALVGAVISVFLTWLTEKMTADTLKEANTAAIGANQYATNTLRNAEVIEAMGMLPRVQERWYKRHKRMLGLQALASNRAGTISAISKFVSMFQQSLILGFGALLVIDGKITPGTMIAGSILMGRALAPIQLAIGTWKGLVSARSSYERLNKVLDAFPHRPRNMTLPAPKGNLVVENLMAAAPGQQVPILRGINLSFQAGTIVGVIGPSGCGKSTLARAIVGVWPPLAGKVRLDGADVHNWNKDELGPFMGYLPQDIELFDGTVAENIARFGSLEPEKIIEAAQMAGVHEMVLRFPQGYDTPIGIGGGVLSGGQRQRIALARALYDTPSLVVLDEPNSNLDDQGEAALVQAVRTLKARGKTVVLVTHRMSILQAVDHLVVMRDGVVQGQGPRDEVLRAIQQQSAAAAAAPATARIA